MLKEPQTHDVAARERSHQSVGYSHNTREGPQAACSPAHVHLELRDQIHGHECVEDTGGQGQGAADTADGQDGRRDTVTDDVTVVTAAAAAGTAAATAAAAAATAVAATAAAAAATAAALLLRRRSSTRG